MITGYQEKLTQQILRNYLDNEKEGHIRSIMGITYDNSDPLIPLKIKYFDNGGNYHHIGYTHVGRFVTLD